MVLRVLCIADLCYSSAQRYGRQAGATAALGEYLRGEPHDCVLVAGDGGQPRSDDVQRRRDVTR